MVPEKEKEEAKPDTEQTKTKQSEELLTLDELLEKTGVSKPTAVGALIAAGMQKELGTDPKKRQKDQKQIATLSEFKKMVVDYVKE